MSLEEEVVLLSFLDKNINVFAWSTFDLIRVSRNIIEHKLQVNLAVKLSHSVVRPKLVVHHMYAQCRG
jgi:outer membrane phospholipase A